MNTKNPASTQSKTLEIIKAQGEITLKGIQTGLALSGSRGYARVCKAIADLVRAGYIERSSRGAYRYIGEPRDLDYTKSQARMVRVIRIRTKRQEPFSARTLSELSTCSHDWSKRYVRFLMDKGFLEKVGHERVAHAKVKVPVYLGIEEKLNQQWPALRRHKKTGEIDGLMAKIRETALRIGRDCSTNKEGLAALSGTVKELGAMIGEALVKMG